MASLYGRNNLVDIVSRAAERLFIPLTVGGGVRSVEDIHRLLRAGADKVAINTAAIKNPQLIREGAQAFGSQCIVLYIEAKQRAPGRYECLTDNARERTGKDVFEWVREAVDLGAGEILLTAVDREGTGQGYDVELTAKVSAMVDIPVIASGGAGTPAHVLAAISAGQADAVCAASIFHYRIAQEGGGPVDRFEEGNVEFLKGKFALPVEGGEPIQPTTITELKSFLHEAGVPVRRIRETVAAQAP